MRAPARLPFLPRQHPSHFFPTGCKLLRMYSVRCFQAPLPVLPFFLLHILSRLKYRFLPDSTHPAFLLSTAPDFYSSVPVSAPLPRIMSDSMPDFPNVPHRIVLTTRGLPPSEFPDNFPHLPTPFSYLPVLLKSLSLPVPIFLSCPVLSFLLFQFPQFPVLLFPAHDVDIPPSFWHPYQLAYYLQTALPSAGISPIFGIESELGNFCGY